MEGTGKDIYNDEENEDDEHDNDRDDENDDDENNDEKMMMKLIANSQSLGHASEAFWKTYFLNYPNYAKHPKYPIQLG